MTSVVADSEVEQAIVILSRQITQLRRSVQRLFLGLVVLGIVIALFLLL